MKVDGIEKNWRDSPKKNEHDMLKYQQWFDSCESIEECVSNGFIDFSHKIFTQDLYKLVGDPKDKTCLEIGFGGGRLINAASKYFKKCYGLDVLSPSSISKTREFLASKGTHNVELLHKENASSIEDASVDFVYSFIVFQHFSNFEEAKNYFSLFNRVLKKGGCGKIYLKGIPKNREISFPKIALKLPENYLKPVLEIPPNFFEENSSEEGCRYCSLFVESDYVCDFLKENFTILETRGSTKKMWNDIPSDQYYIKFIKE